MASTKAVFDRYLKRFRLEDYRSIVKGAAMPAFRMVATKRIARTRTEPVSKVGGEPDLAWDDAWPSSDGHPLHFIAQIRLSDVPEGHLPRGVLPRRGWLRFWLDTIAMRMNADVSPAYFRVTFDRDDRRPLERRRWPRFEMMKLKSDWGGEPWRPFPEAAIEFRPMVSVDHRAVRRLSKATGEREGLDGNDRAFDFIMAVYGEARDGNHRLLGDVLELQSDMRWECVMHAHGLDGTRSISRECERKLEKDEDEYRLLARFDSQAAVLDWCWGDCGSLNWFIREDDLRAGAFERAIGVWDNGG